ncbi:hypothetical protein SAMN04488527_1743 [Aliiroseovarius crassostreae]|uniref:Uncharacterized protein n=1 Tax=Aliiroseovarius crassostreae TaxID=154981 RepID=A0A0N8IBE4_9RHOB|nr:hypothetical protein [Aliiroseovarius crassostreae]KPN62875.1 hypothetical protein AKJ29_01655 [Aliiroseovarius crassostreae]SFU98803.1 hypothetical protein SAMN04488527_1743 [Aliiroseovarius crassostreae]
MKIELKSVKHAAFASEETQCYSASLWVDGKKIGTVSNEGRGGCDSFNGDRGAYSKADEWCKANLPKWEGFDGKMIETDLEMQCGNLLDEWLTTRDLKRAMGKKILFRKPDGNVYEIAHKGQKDAAIAMIQRDHPKAEILNTMPLEDALAIYRTIGAA